jgi:hypothetical protein
MKFQKVHCYREGYVINLKYDEIHKSYNITCGQYNSNSTVKILFGSYAKLNCGRTSKMPLQEKTKESQLAVWYHVVLHTLHRYCCAKYVCKAK